MKRLLLLLVASFVAGQANATSYSYAITPIASAQELCGASPAGCSLPGSYLQLQDTTTGTYSRVPVSGSLTYDDSTGAIGGSIVLNFSVVAGGGILQVIVNTTAYLDSTLSGSLTGGLFTGGGLGAVNVIGGHYDTQGTVQCIEAIAGICLGLAGFPAGITVTDASDVPYDQAVPPNLWGGGTMTFNFSPTAQFANFNLQGNAGRPVHLEGAGAAVPEPGTLMLIASGLTGLAFFGRRRS